MNGNDGSGCAGAVLAAKRPVVVVERPMLTYDERRRLDDVHVVDNPQRRMLR